MLVMLLCGTQTAFDGSVCISWGEAFWWWINDVMFLMVLARRWWREVFGGVSVDKWCSDRWRRWMRSVEGVEMWWKWFEGGGISSPCNNVFWVVYYMDKQKIRVEERRNGIGFFFEFLGWNVQKKIFGWLIKREINFFDPFFLFFSRGPPCGAEMS